jgi:hypothetical protein
LRKIGSQALKGAFALFIVLFAQSVIAQVNVSVRADRNVVRVGEGFVLTVTIESDGTSVVQSVNLPELVGYQVLDQQQSKSVRNVYDGGRFQTKIQYIYRYSLMPQQVSQHQLGPVQLQVDGKSYTTKPVQLKVVGSGGRRQQPRGGYAQPRLQPPRGQRPPPLPQKPKADIRDRFFQDPFADDPFGNDPFFKDADDVFSNLLKKHGLGYRGAPVEPIDPSEALVIQVHIDKREAFVGEQIIASWYLYTPYNIRNIDSLKYPALKGFWKEDIERATRLRGTREIINGREYGKYMLAVAALFPLKPGELEIDPHIAKCKLVGGMGQQSEVKASSRPVQVKVKPLPPGAPANFAGVVGSFRIRAKLDAKTIKANEPFLLKLKIAGRGNARSIDVPVIQWPVGISLYDQQDKSKFTKKATSYKEFELFLIAEKEGEYTLPAIAMPYFNPEKKSYFVAKTKPISITVLPGEKRPEAEGNKLTPEELQPKATPIPLVLPGLVDQSTGEPALDVYTRFWIWFGIFTGILLVLIWRAWVSFGWGQKEMSFRQRTKKRLARLPAMLKADDLKGFGAESLNILYFVLNKQSEGEVAEGSMYKLLSHLPPSLKKQVFEELNELIPILESMAFAPASVAESVRKKQNDKELIKKFEKSLDTILSYFESSENEDSR